MPPLPQAPLEPLKTMREPIDPYWWTFALTSLVQFFLTRTFVEDMATNHLPHIYSLLEKLCDEKGTETAPSPQIRWIDLNGPRH